MPSSERSNGRAANPRFEPPAICTIVAKNYFALAKVLMESVRAAHPEAPAYVLVVDGKGLGAEYAIDGVTLLSPYDILDVATFENMAYSYDVTELSTALKPFVLSHLLMNGHRAAIYLDPDIVVFRPLRHVLDALGTHNIVLTPHLTSPIPLDGKEPDELTILQAGTYNLGFIAVSGSAETLRFLTWWQERLLTGSIVDVAAGLFTDQKWINLVPGIFSAVKILRSPTLNIAYWNLHERRIDRKNPLRLASGEEIVFFHFSGFDARNVGKLSKYQDRIDVQREPGLAALLKLYAQRLDEAGHSRFRTAEYGFARFSNGIRLDTFARRAHRDALIAGRSFRRPADARLRGGLYDWLNTPADIAQPSRPPYLTNYLRKFYEMRRDLHPHFPQPVGAHREAFFAWLDVDQEHGVPAEFIRAAYDRTEPVAVPPSDFSLNAIGYFKAESGTGEHARANLAAIRSLGIPVRLVDVSHTTISRLGDDSAGDGEAEGEDLINLSMVNADEALNVRQVVGEELFRDRYNIAYWAWELPEFPEEWSDRFGYFDEIWVGSNFVRDAIAQRSPLPVVRVPMVITVPKETAPNREQFGFQPDEKVFLYVFDFLSMFERKNPLAAIDAFRIAFPGNERVRLVLKFSNSNVDPENRERLYAAVGKDPRITMIDRYLSREEKNSLLASCDAYVSLHRSEGFGITMAEAMLLEKPVIATNWSGNVDFLNAENGYPVAYRLVPVGRDMGPYKSHQLWADADRADAARAMRAVYDRPEHARRIGIKAAVHARRELSAAAAAAIVAPRLRAGAAIARSRRRVPVLA